MNKKTGFHILGFCQIVLIILCIIMIEEIKQKEMQGYDYYHSSLTI